MSKLPKTAPQDVAADNELFQDTLQLLERCYGIAYKPGVAAAEVKKEQPRFSPDGSTSYIFVSLVKDGRGFVCVLPENKLNGSPTVENFISSLQLNSRSFKTYFRKWKLTETQVGLSQIPKEPDDEFALVTCNGYRDVGSLWPHLYQIYQRRPQGIIIQLHLQQVSLPPSHPLHRVFKCCQCIPCFHHSPIHHLLGAFPLLRCAMETIDPHLVIAPAPPGSLSTRIVPDKDMAWAEVEDTGWQGGFSMYTDSSGFEGGVGAAAIAWNGDREGACRMRHLGTMGEHTVFEAEVVGAILVLDITKGTPRCDVDCVSVGCTYVCRRVRSDLSSGENDQGSGV
ncbi:hypothetical protein C8J57DRAFT_1500423 [Mycena rebaudengoi]|nr:hypothetical protein C8J57DRAFT_1500423 [Mycena rebaudengoi]